MTHDTTRHDGGPAFPAHPSALGDHDGMSLRDYLATKAMQSIRADQSFGLRNDPDIVADRAYEQADAMLRARKA